MGSKITLLDAESHDQALALSSHLPHVVASALAFATPHEILPFVGKGWLDSTRIAGSNPQLWRQILEENRAPALHALKKFATICETWIEALEGSDFDRIEELLQSGKTTRESVASRHSPG
jgi:prephenate dehydrogenase